LIKSRLLAAISEMKRVTVLPLEETMKALEVTDIHDRYLESLAEIPYRSAFFASAATSVMRGVFQVRRRPYKVIVADCDHTLWRGIVGEDGPLGVKITPACRALQELLLRQAQNGVLLCLCSRNNEADVIEVFRSNPDMLLSWDDIVSHRIGWGAKPSAVAELASELDLALDSFIFLDDDAVECQRMEHECPDVLTLLVPGDEEGMGALLERLWMFDGSAATAEDRKRAMRYRHERRRREVKQTSASLQDFIAGLELKIELREVAPNDCDRVAQIMERTTQFNTTGLRLTPAEIGEHVRGDDGRFLMVEVSDRFGDYGKSGLLVIDRAPDTWTVECFALSCRVLGRDVEYRIAELLAKRGRQAGASAIAFDFRQTHRNVPAQRFLGELRKEMGQARAS
jgi:FkbH-like protein